MSEVRQLFTCLGLFALNLSLSSSVSDESSEIFVASKNSSWVVEFRGARLAVWSTVRLSVSVSLNKSTVSCFPEGTVGTEGRKNELDCEGGAKVVGLKNVLVEVVGGGGRVTGLSADL